MPKTKMVELPEDLMQEIRTRLEARIGELAKYDIPQNSADHMMLVAVPLAREEVVNVTFDDKVIDKIMPWLNTGETNQNMHSRVEELAYRFGVDMVRHYRPDFSS